MKGFLFGWLGFISDMYSSAEGKKSISTIKWACLCSYFRNIFLLWALHTVYHWKIFIYYISFMQGLSCKHIKKDLVLELEVGVWGFLPFVLILYFISLENSFPPPFQEISHNLFHSSSARLLITRVTAKLSTPCHQWAVNDRQH